MCLSLGSIPNELDEKTEHCLGVVGEDDVAEGKTLTSVYVFDLEEPEHSEGDEDACQARA